ncbi:MAG: polymerase sigma factor YlaC [Bacteroidota bacterium]|jgi:RNA polymerase sigma-70 factor (ECF subfamily)
MPTSSTNPEQWVLEYSDSLLRFAYMRVFSREIAHDLVQETFLAALRTRNNFRGESSEKTWLTAILKRKIVDHFRQKSRTDKYILSEADTSERVGTHRNNGQWIGDKAPQLWADNMELLIENEEFMLTFGQCLAKLPSKWAVCFTMKHLDEMDTEDICKELDLTASNYWVIIHRAKLKLRECIEKHWLS